MNSLYVSRFRLFHKGYLDVVKYILGKDEGGLILGIEPPSTLITPTTPLPARKGRR